MSRAHVRSTVLGENRVGLPSKTLLTTSVALISGSPSMGAAKKPCRIFLASHCPSVLVYGLPLLLVLRIRLGPDKLTPTSSYTIHIVRQTSDSKVK